MSNYGNPPIRSLRPEPVRPAAAGAVRPEPLRGSEPYGQQPAYAQGGYGAPQAGFAPPYASWIQRVAAYLIDGLLPSSPTCPAWSG